MREMKDSRIEWIGEIPDNWEVSTVKREYVFQTGWTPDTTHEEYFIGENIWINISDMKSKFVYDSEKHISDEAVQLASMNISPKGSLLYAFKLSVGAVSFCGMDMYTNEAIATFLPGKNNLRFLYYTAPIFIIKNANENIYGAKLLNQKLIRNAKIVIPPLEVQERIADYLDRKCSQIDAIIARQQEVIEKLKAYKLSVITEAVTKGLNPDVPMKDSGVEWIGEIPEHWDILKLQAHTRMLTPMRDRPEKLDGDIPWVRIEDYDGKYISASKEGLGVSTETVKEMNLKIYPVGSILCTSSCDLGKCAIVTRELVSNQRFINITPDSNTNSDYLYYLMISNAERLNHLSTGTIQANLSRKAFEHLMVQFPPISEQKAISEYLDRKCEAVELSINKKQELIDRLSSYKKSLIYEVVTGKKEV